MATADRIERERRAKRVLIMEAARELFLERGYEAVTLREIASRIEHSTTAVYVHFKDKRDLLQQIVAEDFAKFGAALAATAEVRPARARLARLGVAYMQFGLTLPRHYQLLFLTPAPEDALDAPEDGNAPGFGAFQMLVDTVREAMAEGAFRADLTDPVAVAQAIWAALHGLVSLFIIMGDVPFFDWRKPEVLFEVLMGSLSRGLMRDGVVAELGAPEPGTWPIPPSPCPPPRAPRADGDQPDRADDKAKPAPAPAPRRPRAR